MDQDIYEVLTSEQKEKVQQLLKEKEARRNEENRNQQNFRKLKDRQDRILCAYFTGFATIVLMIILCGLSIFFIPGENSIFDTLLGVTISLTGFCGFLTCLLIPNYNEKLEKYKY